MPLVRWGLVITATAIGPAHAEAASVRVNMLTDVRGAPTGHQAFYVAADGEANRLRVTLEGQAWRFRDDGAEVSAGDGCRSIDIHEAICAVPGEDLVPPGLHVKDRDDHVSAVGAAELVAGEGNDVVDADAFDVSLGPGDDVFTGGPRSNRVSGGTGRDVMRAGGGSDGLSDTDEQGTVDSDVMHGGAGRDVVFYSGRTNPVTVDLRRDGPGGEAGENDDLRSLEGAYGGDGADVLIGTNGPNDLVGWGGANRIVGHAGDDFIGVDGPASDHISSGRGNDIVTLGEGGEGAESPDRVDCGSGSKDEIEGVGRFTVVPVTCERIRWIADDEVMRLRRPARSGAPIAAVSVAICATRRCRWTFRASLPRYRGQRYPAPGRTLGRHDFVAREGRRRLYPLRLNRRGRQLLARRRRLRVLLSLETPRGIWVRVLVELRA